MRAITSLLAGAAVVLAGAIWFTVRPADGGRSPLDGPLPASAASAADWLDPTKVLDANLPSETAVTRSAVAVWQDGMPVDLKSFLRAGVRADTVSWTADGKPVAGGLLDPGRRPGDNHVRGVLIVARDATEHAEAFALVLVPPSTPRQFADWLRQERASMQWTESLPPLYARLGPNHSNPEPAACRPRMWPTLRSIHTHYHPGAAYEMRSAIRPDGSGHQATYTASGELLRRGPSAGSADRGSPSWNIFRLIGHMRKDVIPWVWAAQLDGNPVNPARFYSNFDRPLIRAGQHIQDYLEVRPTYGPAHREVEPGRCVDGTLP
ncbi:MAG: hypothetical protein LAP87_22020 [Acidobacteriia bacterium]|nr:hypothetical protein [Terriglobia bacterium]